MTPRGLTGHWTWIPRSESTGLTIETLKVSQGTEPRSPGQSPLAWPLRHTAYKTVNNLQWNNNRHANCIYIDINATDCSWSNKWCTDQTVVCARQRRHPTQLVVFSSHGRKSLLCWRRQWQTNYQGPRHLHRWHTNHNQHDCYTTRSCIKQSKHVEQK